MGAVAPVVGLGLSAVGQFSQASAQQKQINSQAKAMEQQNLIAKHQLEISQQNAEYTKTVAAVTRDRQKAIMDAQQTQQEQQAREIALKQAMGYSQAELQMQQIVESAKQQAQQILMQAANQSNQTNQQATQQDKQINAAMDKTLGVTDQVLNKTAQNSGSNAQGLRSSLGNDVNQVLAQQQQAVAQNNLDSTRQNIQTQEASDKAVALNDKQAALTSSFLGQNLEFQKQLDQQSAQAAATDNAYTYQRNLIGNDANYYATVASQDLNQVAAGFQYQNDSAVRQAQMASMKSQSPGLLTYANIAGGLFNGLNQMGAFNFGGGGNSTSGGSNFTNASNYSLGSPGVISSGYQSEYSDFYGGNIYG